MRGTVPCMSLAVLTLWQLVHTLARFERVLSAGLLFLWSTATAGVITPGGQYSHKGTSASTWRRSFPHAALLSGKVRPFASFVQRFAAGGVVHCLLG